VWFFFLNPRDRSVVAGPDGRRSFPSGRLGTGVPSLGVSRSQWPVVAWIRLKVPPPPAPMTLMPGPPPPPQPPLEILEPNPVATDPRRRVFAYEVDEGDLVVRLVWDSDDPTLLEAECRAPLYHQRLPRADVQKFWAAVKRLVAPIGPLPIESADPRP
jgi:hypothetical protein